MRVLFGFFVLFRLFSAGCALKTTAPPTVAYQFDQPTRLIDYAIMPITSS
jgi:hypothetical protein